MGASVDSAPPAFAGYLPAQLIAHSYLGGLWIALDQRQGTPGRPVLLRHLQLQEGIPSEALQRMACAARDAMALSHENVLHVLSVLQQAESLAVAYEYVEAEPLRSLQSCAAQRGQRFPVAVSLRIVVDLARGIKALHGTLAGWPSAPPFGGISPDSVLVARDGRTRLCDALTASCATLLEGLGLNVAKLAYTAPEQAYATAPLAPAADVFSCGVLLWELLAGARLLTGSRPTVERKLLEHDWPHLATQLAGQTIAPALLKLVERCLASDASKRPPSPAALASELEQCGEAVAQLPDVARFIADLAAPHFDQRKLAVRASLLLPAQPAPTSQPAPLPAAASPPELAVPARVAPPAPLEPAPPPAAQRSLPAAARPSAASLRIPLPAQLSSPSPRLPLQARPSAAAPIAATSNASAPAAIPKPASAGASSPSAAAPGRYSLTGGPDGVSLARVPLLRAAVPRPRNSQPALRAVSLPAHEPAPAGPAHAPTPAASPHAHEPSLALSLPAEQPKLAIEPAPPLVAALLRSPAAEPTPSSRPALSPTPQPFDAPALSPTPQPFDAPALSPTPQPPEAPVPVLLEGGGSVSSGPSLTPGALTARERASSAVPAAAAGSSPAPATASAAPPVPIFGVRRLRRAGAEQAAAPGRSQPPLPSDAPATERSPSLHGATSTPPARDASIPPDSGWGSLPPVATPGPPAAPAVAADPDAPLSQEAVVIPEARALHTGMTTLMGIPVPPPVLLPSMPFASVRPPRVPVMTPGSSPAVVVIPPESSESAPPPAGSSLPPLPMGSLVPTLSPPPFSEPPSAPSSATGLRRESGWSQPPAPRSTRRPRRRSWLARAGATLALGTALATVLWVRDAGRGTSYGAGSAVAPHAAALPPASNLEPSRPAAPAATAAPTTLAKPTEAAPVLSDAQLLELFALEQRGSLAECTERRPAARLAASRARQKSQAQLKAAQREQARGNISAAQALLCSATQLQPGNVAAWQALAELALLRGDGAQAERILQRALGRRPGERALLAALGDAEALLGNLQQSRSLWARSAPARETEAQPQQRLAAQSDAAGERALRAGAFASALTYYRRAVVLSAGASAPSAGMARALRGLNQPHAALPWESRAAALGE